MTDKKKNYGGSRSGAGRKPIEKRLSNYDKALSLLDNNIIKAIQLLITGMKSKNQNYKLRCAELLLKKSLPDKKSIDMSIKDKFDPLAMPVPDLTPEEKKEIEKKIQDFFHNES